jgi:hypothetical protein
MVIAINVGATFETAGPHAVVIRSGTEELRRSRFYVARVPQNEQQLGNA